MNTKNFKTLNAFHELDHCFFCSLYILPNTSLQYKGTDQIQESCIRRLSGLLSMLQEHKKKKTTIQTHIKVTNVCMASCFKNKIWFRELIIVTWNVACYFMLNFRQARAPQKIMIA